MTLASVRRRLGLLVSLWLLGQVFSWSAVAAHLCCLETVGQAEQAASGGEAGTDASCHKVVVDHCPMAAADGQPCPMHAGGASAHQHADGALGTNASGDAEAAAAACVMRGTCTSSASALLTLLWVPGVLVPPQVTPADIVSPVVMARPAPLVTRSLSHDPPPPRG